ncbi:hypothetical protein C7S18_01755 [Ahniella affigens]|uniref:FG-GAP repeat protein n=1 Tax=Ahniella affigens TaxID=2021234 RepID=A0A2P1PME0_9GAMM|nr:hypothetical protein [Ahniella affigens]AVP95992.1 hypothetical protein C7S18_01755 [Ahniella affigens]
MRAVILGLLGYLALVDSSDAAALETLWSQSYGLNQPGYAGVLSVDLDGDGNDEAVITGNDEPGFDPTGIDLLAVLDRDPTSPSRFRIGTYRRLGPGADILGKIVRYRPVNASADRVLVSVIASGQATLLQFAGPDLHLETSVPLPSGFQLNGVGDVDADGTLDGYGCYCAGGQFGVVGTISLQTGAATYVGTEQANRVGAGQLDSDPALELILASNWTISGRVMDGASHAFDAVDPVGFHGEVLVGNFIGGPDIQEFFISAGPVGARLYSLTPSFGAVRDISAGQLYSLTAADLDDDGIDELLTGDRKYAGVKVYDTTTGDEIDSFVNANYGVDALTVGNFNDQPGLELLITGGLGTTQRDIVYVYDVTSTEARFRQNSSWPPEIDLALADLDQDGSLEAIYEHVDSKTTPTGRELFIANASDGALLRSQEFHYNDVGAYGGVRMQAANLDADPQAEIMISTGLSDSTHVRAIDSVSLSSQWGFDYNGFNNDMHDMAIVPLPNQAPRVVLAMRYNTVGMGDNGNMMWFSTVVGQSAPGHLATGNVDSDPDAELVWASGSWLILQELTDGAFLRLFDVGAPILDVGVETIDGQCRLVAMFATELVRYRCSDGVELSRRQYGGVVAQAIAVVTDSEGPLVLAAGDRVYIRGHSDNLAVSEPLGRDVGINNQMAVAKHDNKIWVFAASRDSVHMLRHNLVDFADGFEAP